MYIDALLQCYSLKNTKLASSLMNPSICLTSDQVFKLTNKITKIAKILYQETIGTLIYMVLKTYLNIIYAVQLLSYFSKNLKESYWKTVQYAFIYLKNTHELWLTYGRLVLDLYGYTDTNKNIAEDWHSTSGYAFQQWCYFMEY